MPPRSFAGIEDNYFLEALLPRERLDRRAPSPSRSRRPRGQAVARDRDRRRRHRRRFEASAYFGPKDVSILESYGLGLERTVDFGWYGILARPLLWLLKQTLRARGQLGPRDPRRDLPHPAGALPAHREELRLDEEDAEARAEDERDPRQVQEGEDRRGAAAEDEHGADGALPGRRLQPDERLPADRCCSCRSCRVLQRAVATRSSCATRPSSSGSRTSRRSTRPTCSSS